MACFPGAANLVARGCAEDYELYREPEDQAMGLCATCQPFHMDLSKSGLDIRVCVCNYTPNYMSLFISMAQVVASLMRIPHLAARQNLGSKPGTQGAKFLAARVLNLKEGMANPKGWKNVEK